MADNNTLFFDLGLNTEQLEKDIVKARKRIAEMQIKAELDIEIPDISVKAFEKKVKELQAQMDKMTNIHNKAGYGIGSPEQKQFEEASQKLNKRIELYKKNIERLNSIDVSGGSSVNMKISGDEKVLNVIERINAGLSDLNMRIGLEGDEEVLRRLKEIEAVKNGLAELSTVKIDLKTQENTFSKTEVDKQIADAVAAKVEELEKKYKALAEAKEKAAKAGKDKPKEEDLEKNLANLEKQLQRIQTFNEKMDVRMENIVGGDFSEKGYKRLQALYDEYEALAANKSLSAQQVKDFQAKITAETQVVNALISAQQKYNSAQDKAREKQRKDDEKAEKEHLKNLDKLSKATQRAQLAELDVIKSGDKGDEQRIAKYLNQVKRLNEEIRELNNLEAKFRHQQIVGNISQDQLDAILSKLNQYRQELERIANLDMSEFTDDLFNDNTGQAFRGVIQELNMDLSDAVAKQRKFKQATDESGEALRNQKKPAEEFNETLNFGLGYASQLKEMIRDTFSLYGIKRFAEQVITIGGEFEKQKIALKSILGDAIQAEVIYSQIKNLAVKSPFEFKDLTSYAKQLSAFSIPYNELFDTTKRLADISAGLGVDMGRIILAYGQVRSAAVLRGQELRQFTEAGIPLVQELADRFTELENKTVSTGDVFDRISKRMVSFEMVQDILFDMTEEGGKFFEMQEELAESLSGKWSNLKDAYNIMLSEIAEGNSGVLKGSIEAITWLINRWEHFGSILSGVAMGYITYKTILAATNVVQAANVLLTLKTVNANIAEAASIAAKNGAMTKGAATIIKYANSLKTLWAALGAFGKIGLIISAIVGLGTWIYSVTRRTDELADSLDKTSGLISVKLNSDIKDFKQLVDTLGKSVEGTIEHTTILNKIKSKYGEFVKDIDLVTNAYDKLKNKVDDVTNAMRLQAQTDFINRNKLVLEDTTGKDIDDVTDEINKAYNAAFKQDEAKALAMSTAAIAKINDLLTRGFNPNGEEFDDIIRNYLSKTLGDGSDLGINLGLLEKDLVELAQYIKKYEDDIKRIESTAQALFKIQDNSIKPLTGWRESVESFVEGITDKISRDILNPQIPRQEDVPLNDWAKGVLNLYDEALKQAKLDEKVGLTNPELLDDKQVEHTKNTVNALSLLIKKFNLEMFREEKGGGGASDDPVADMWEKRIELLEKAQTLYKKWVDVEGHEAALKRVQGDETFGSIFSDKNLADILTDPDKVWRYIQSQLGGTEKQKELSTELDLKISERSYENVKKDADRFIEQLKNSLERSAERWDIYNDLIKAGFDKNVAASVAGGISFTSYVDELKHQLATQLEGSGISIEDALLGKADLSKVKNASFIGYLVDEINKENKRLNSESAKNLAELVKNYRNYEQKITEINRSLETDISTIRGSDLSNEDKERMIEERRRVAKEDISKADFEEFKRTSDWVKVFDDLDRVSNDTLDSMIANIEKFIEGGVESEEVLKQIIEALRKLREEDIERNPFMASSKAAVRLADAYKARKLFKDNPYAEIYHGIQRGEEDNAIKAAKQDLENSFNEIGNKFKELSNVVGEVSKMMESFGNKSLTEFASILDSMASGFSSGTSAGKIFGGVGGMLGGVAGTIVGMFSGIYASAERATQKEIEASDARRAEMETYRNILESVISKSLTGLYNLGMPNSTREKLEKLAADYETRRKAYGYDINSNNIMARFEDDVNFPWESDRRYAYSGETERRIQQALKENNPYLAQLALLLAERDEYVAGHLKDDDFKAKLEEYNKDIEELTTGLMSDLYSINFEDWASRLANSIVDAWAAGEDAVGAYKNTVEDMLRDVATSMVQQQIIGSYIQEHLSPLITQLIDAGGKVDENFFDMLVQAMSGLEGAVSESEDMLNILEEAANKAGYSIKNNKDDANSLSSGIKGVTEDTANLVASYLNAIRQDVSIKRAEIIKLVNDLFPQHFVLCQAQLQQLNMIQQNTKITADKITEMNNNFNAVLNGTKKVSVK